jgi:DNA topoisomerase-1
MELAPALYEAGGGTYQRTDSPNLSQEAIEAIRALAEEKNWPLPDVPRTWKAKEGAQEAHEAIRAVHAEQENAGENEEERSLYALIRLRALASQLADAVYAVRVLRLSADLDGQEAIFEARGRTLMTEGWKVLLHADQADETETEAENPVPSMKPGGKVLALSGTVLTKKTKPAPRFTEAALIWELEKRGIGRPSTYAAILDTIAKRGYAATEKRFLVPTPLGEKLIEALAGKFSFSDYSFTRDMEQALDDIASGKGEYKAVVSHAHDQLQKELAAFLKATGKVCPKCGRAMVRRAKPGKGGYDFWGCSGYPDCKEKL